MENQIQDFETLAVHAGCAPDPSTGARSTPIYQTTSFVFESVERAAALFNLEQAGYIYSRLTNPTVAALQTKLAALEQGVGATCTASGHAAQMLALFPLMAPGLEFIASKKLYGGSINQFTWAFIKFGWKVVFVDPDNLDEIQQAVNAKTRAIFVEGVANPGGVLVDLESIAKIANQAEVPLIVDNTLATPYLCQPILHGADIVVHSTTKFLSGHGNAIGGVVIDSGKFDWFKANKYPSLTEPEPAYHGIVFAKNFGELALTMHGHAIGLRDLGAALAPMNAYLTLCGVETLPLRMQRQTDNALAVAKWLKQHPAVSWVSYAGLEDDKYHALSQKYTPKGSGAVFTFGVKGGYEAGIKLVENVKLHSHLANVGDTRSLIIHPASTTHRQLPKENLEAAGAGPDVVRLSVGIESVKDIIQDLEQAL